MPNVKLESVQEGMIVTVDVKNMDNMLLIPAGCALTEKHIHILNAWGIPEIQVQSAAGSEACGEERQGLSSEVLEKLAAELRPIFWDPIDENPVQKEVFDLVLRRKARQFRPT